jgi:hypothetical protein
MSKSWDGLVGATAEAVAEELLTRIDSDEKRYPDYESWKHLRVEIAEIIEGAIADWLLQKQLADDRMKERAG